MQIRAKRLSGQRGLCRALVQCLYVPPPHLLPTHSIDSPPSRSACHTLLLLTVNSSVFSCPSLHRHRLKGPLLERLALRSRCAQSLFSLPKHWLTSGFPLLPSAHPLSDLPPFLSLFLSCLPKQPKHHPHRTRVSNRVWRRLQPKYSLWHRCGV